MSRQSSDQQKTNSATFYLGSQTEFSCVAYPVITMEIDPLEVDPLGAEEWLSYHQITGTSINLPDQTPCSISWFLKGVPQDTASDVPGPLLLQVNETSGIWKVIRPKATEHKEEVPLEIKQGELYTSGKLGLILQPDFPYARQGHLVAPARASQNGQ